MDRFLLESQACALVGLCLTTTAVGASTLLGTMSVLGALPVIASSCGSARLRLWRKPTVSARTLWLCGLGGCAGLVLLNVGYDAIYTLLAHAHPPGQPTLPLLIKAKIASLWVSYASAAVLLPAAEEVIFRGYLFDALRRYFSDAKVILITALMFAAAHFQWTYFVPLAGFGLILGWTRYKTDSLWLPVLLHLINNGVALIPFI